MENMEQKIITVVIGIILLVTGVAVLSAQAQGEKTILANPEPDAYGTTFDESVTIKITYNSTGVDTWGIGDTTITGDTAIMLAYDTGYIIWELDNHKYMESSTTEYSRTANTYLIFQKQDERIVISTNDSLAGLITIVNDVKEFTLFSNNYNTDNPDKLMYEGEINSDYYGTVGDISMWGWDYIESVSMYSHFYIVDGKYMSGATATETESTPSPIPDVMEFAQGTVPYDVVSDVVGGRDDYGYYTILSKEYAQVNESNVGIISLGMIVLVFAMLLAVVSIIKYRQE